VLGCVQVSFFLFIYVKLCFLNRLNQTEPLNAAVRQALFLQSCEPVNQERPTVISITQNEYGEKAIDVTKMSYTVCASGECVSISIQVNFYKFKKKYFL
jgi:hypothetical protein